MTTLSVAAGLALAGPAAQAAPGEAEHVETAERAERPTASSRDAAEDRLAALVDEVRAEGRSCGEDRMDAVRPLDRSGALDAAAGGFATLMAERDFFSHTAPNGSDPGARARAEGFRGSVSEAIAAGHRGPASVVRAWLASPDHCRILMTRGAKRVGVGYAQSASSEYGTYWVLAVG